MTIIDFKSFSNHLALLSILSSTSTIILIAGQALPPVTPPPINNTIKSINNETFQISYTNISICAEGDKLSQIYCKCTEKVTSCDFSMYPGSMQNRTELGIYVDDMKRPVKRLCLCGCPRHVLLNLTRKSGKISKHNNLGSLHRVDIYNISGPLHITEAFQSPFAGDFYMKNVTHLYSLRSEQFNHGSDLKIEDVQDLDCCSQINVPQQHSKPTLYMDSVRIGDIYPRSISSYHVWRTVILKYLKVRRIAQRGIALESMTEHVNVSITYCNFENVTHQGIVLGDFHNAFISKNTFDKFSEADAFQAVSKIANSSLIILDNWFNNKMVLDMAAHRVLNWFNLYDLWDNWTFAIYPEQPFSDALYSIEYNTVQYFLMAELDPLAFRNSSMLTHENVIFHENVLGSCNCSSVHGIHLPERISMHTTRCDPLPFHKLSTTTPSPNEDCLVDLKTVISTCTDESTTLNPSSLCKNGGIKKPSFSQNTMKKLAFKATGVKIISPFISEMMKELKFRFFIHHVFPHSEEDEEKHYAQYDDGDDKDTDLNSTHVGLVTILVLLSIAILSGAVFFLVKQTGLRRVLLRDSSNLSESYDILTTST